MADVNKTILLEYDLKTGKLIDENGKVIKSLKQFVDELNKATQAQQQMGDVIGKNSEVIFGSISHIRNQIGALKQQRDNAVIGSTEFDNLTNRIENLQGELKKATTATLAQSNAQEKTSKTTKELAKLQENQARSAGLAGATAFELGRTISDLPFGLVAVSNNISQLGTLFAALVANAKGFTNAIKLLKAQLIGPSGILIAFQIVTAAVTFFAQRQNKAKEAAEEFTAKMILQGNVLVGLRKLFLESNAPIEAQLELLKALALADVNLNKILERENLTQEQRIDLAEEYVAALQKLEEREAELIKNRDKINKVNKDLDVSQEKLLENEREVSRLRGLPDPRGQVADEIFRLESENRAIRSQLELLSTVTKQLNFVANERERINELATKRTDFIFLTPEEAKEQEKAAQDAKKISEENLKTVDDFRLKLLEISAKSETELLQIQRQAAIDEVAQGKNAKEAIAAINAFFDEKERIAKKEQAEELKKISDKSLKDELNRLEKQLTEKSRIVANELRMLKTFVKEQQDLVFLRREVQALESGDDTNFRNFKLRFYEIMMNDQQLSEADRLAAKKQYLLLKKEGDEEEIQSDKDLATKKQEQFEHLVELTKSAFSAIMELTMAQAQAEADIEEAKTNKQNDELRRRLANEELSAEQRDKINQEIARNEAELVEKQNKINKRQFEQQKAANIAIATIDTYVAANQALKNPLDLGPVAKFASVALVIAAGLANVAAIARQQFVPKALPSPNLSGLGASSESSGPSFNVVGQSTRNQVAEAVGLALADQPLRAYVVSSDVTTAQELERKIVEGASI